MKVGQRASACIWHKKRRVPIWQPRLATHGDPSWISTRHIISMFPFISPYKNPDFRWEGHLLISPLEFLHPWELVGEPNEVMAQRKLKRQKAAKGWKEPSTVRCAVWLQIRYENSRPIPMFKIIHPIADNDIFCSWCSSVPSKESFEKQLFQNTFGLI